MRIIKNVQTAEVIDREFNNDLYSTTLVRKFEENYYPELHRFRFEIVAGDGAKLLKHIKRWCDIDCVYSLLAGNCKVNYVTQVIVELAGMTELGDTIHVLDDKYVIRRVK